ncbi:hypothetical protein HAX54_041293 [Datura stramonium]|uniref:No apical meristem-associated C-terminal domain-containing protein n=1 Tax=Datura stramonium TaxID=4076 RepID=A0ABS8SLD3_DATST|nr:hypothetical protein [Datura stramonium]
MDKAFPDMKIDHWVKLKWRILGLNLSRYSGDLEDASNGEDQINNDGQKTSTSSPELLLPSTHGQSPKIEKKAHRDGGVSKKGKKAARHEEFEEIERLTMLVAQKDVEIDVLKASQSSAVPSALLDLKEENLSVEK